MTRSDEFSFDGEGGSDGFNPLFVAQKSNMQAMACTGRSLCPYSVQENVPMTQPARRKQTAITIRSARAAERLALLTRDGRSQARVIEEALEQMPLPMPRIDRQAIRTEIAAIVARGRNLSAKSLEAIDAEMYDENGMPQ